MVLPGSFFVCLLVLLLMCFLFKPRKDNEARKEGLLAGLYSETFEAQVESVSHAWKDVTDKARKQGHLACGSWAACEDAVESRGS